MSAAYIKIGDIEGDSTDARYPKWIPVESLSFGRPGPTAISRNSLRGDDSSFREKDILVVIAHSRASPVLFKMAAVGTHIPKVVLVLATMDDGVVGSAMVLTDVTLSGYQFSGPVGGTSPLETLTMTFNELKREAAAKHRAKA